MKNKEPSAEIVTLALAPGVYDRLESFAREAGLGERDDGIAKLLELWSLEGAPENIEGNESPSAVDMAASLLAEHGDVLKDGAMHLLRAALRRRK